MEHFHAWILFDARVYHKYMHQILRTASNMCVRVRYIVCRINLFWSKSMPPTLAALATVGSVRFLCRKNWFSFASSYLQRASDILETHRSGGGACCRFVWLRLDFIVCLIHGFSTTFFFLKTIFRLVYSSFEAANRADWLWHTNEMENERWII